jgi:hypothetical protein
VDVRLGVVELQEQHLGHDQVGAVVVDGALQKYDAVLEQAAVDIERPFFAAGLFNHIWNERHENTPGSPGRPL